MKIVANILRVILISILAVCLITIGIITIVSSTILDKNYIISKLEETNFYEETYKLVEENFENYIYQSGLEEKTLENICSKEKVKKDINIMLSNIYDGTNKKIDTTEIRDNLNKNIDSQKVRNKQNSGAIEQFINHICEEYESTLIHTEYESKINNIYTKVINILDKLKIATVITIAIDIILLIIVNIKQISKLIQAIGIALFSGSAFYIIAYSIITTKVDVAGIKIFNDAFSKTIVTIVQDVLSKLQSLGIIAIIVAIVLIIIYALIIAITKKEVLIEE